MFIRFITLYSVSWRQSLLFLFPISSAILYDTVHKSCLLRQQDKASRMCSDLKCDLTFNLKIKKSSCHGWKHWEPFRWTPVGGKTCWARPALFATFQEALQNHSHMLESDTTLNCIICIWIVNYRWSEIRVSSQNQLQGHILVVKNYVQRLSGPGLTGTIIGAITGTGQGACASVVQLPFWSASWE